MHPAPRLAGAIGALALLATRSGSQPPSARPAFDTTAFDTTALDADGTAVYRTWQAYLASKAGRYSERAGMPSPYWVDDEQRRWPVYDLAGFYLLDGARPQVTGIERVGDEYRVTTRFRAPGPEGGAPTWWSAMTVTVYAVRDGDAWRLAGALPRLTRAWRRETVGPITYVHASDYPYDAARARRAVAFADSLAEAFGVPRIAPLTYYLASSVDEVYAIMGLTSDVTFGAVGGAAQPVNHMLFSGIPAIGEEYRHELAHLVLAPLCCTRTSYIVSEGVATWLGGTTGMDYPTAVRGLATFLAERPAVTLDSLLGGGLSATRVYPAGAVVTQMVFDAGGVAAVRRLMDGGRTPDELRATLVRELRRAWPAILREWHDRVLRTAARPPAPRGADRVPVHSGRPRVDG